MDVAARVLGKPPANRGALVRTGVVEDEVDLELCGHARFDPVQEAAEFSRPVPAVRICEDLPHGHIEGGKQRGRAVALIVVGPPLDLTRLQGQQRRGAIEGLNLGFVVDAEHDGVRRRREVQAYGGGAPNSAFCSDTRR